MQNLGLFFLPYEMLYGKGRLSIFEKIGVRAKVTDKCLAQGCYDYDGYGYYWTKTDDGDNDARAVDGYGNSNWYNVNYRYLGCRPASTFSSIQKILPSGARLTQGEEGVQEFAFGHDWKNACSKNEQERLEKLYRNGKMNISSRAFTSDECNLMDYGKPFIPKKEEVYEYEGRFYVRTKIRLHGSAATFSNGICYKNGSYVWFDVVPQTWLLDEETGICITKDLAFAGVPFNHVRDYKTENFNNTDVKRYMDEYYSKELMQFINVDTASVECNSPFIVEKCLPGQLKTGDYVLYERDIWCVKSCNDTHVVLLNFNSEVKVIDNPSDISKVTIK